MKSVNYLIIYSYLFTILIKNYLTEDFFQMFIEFYISFWKFHFEKGNFAYCKEFKLFIDFTEFSSQIEKYLLEKYQNLAWILTLRKKIENNLDTYNFINFLYEIIKKEMDVRMRKILLCYLKSFYILEKDETKLNGISHVLKIYEIQIKYTKETRLITIRQIINEIKHGIFGLNSLLLYIIFLKIKRKKQKLVKAYAY